MVKQKDFCIRLIAPHLICVRPEEEEVEGDGGDQVDDEPPAKVVHGDLGRLRSKEYEKINYVR